MNPRLNDYLLQDIKDLIEAINNDELLQDITINTKFETLGDFANYWSKHLNQLQRTNQNNGQTIEYR